MALLVLTPLVAVLVLVLGLRIGGKGAVRAASVWASPPSAARGEVVLQIVTFLDDRGVREAVHVSAVDVSVTEVTTGKVTHVVTDTNVDGVIELSVPLTHAKSSELDVLVRTNDEPRPLSTGRVTVPRAPFGPNGATARPARVTKRTGELVVDLYVTDEKLVVGYPVPSVVHVTRAGGAAVSNAEITLTADPGLDAEPFSRTCDDGYAFGNLRATFHTVGLTIAAKTPDGKEGTTFLALPVAHGAFYVDAAREVAPMAPFAVTVRAPGERKVAYAEIDDDDGRVFATTLALTPEPSGPSAAFLAPPLPEGTYWIVTSGDPRGAEKLEGAAIARAINVRKDNKIPPSCRERAALAMRPGFGFTRQELLDGLPERRSDDTKRARLGLAIALIGLFAAAVIETTLALRIAREARETIESAVRALDEEGSEVAPAARVTKRASAGSVVVGIALVVLGFALLAALLVWKA